MTRTEGEIIGIAAAGSLAGRGIAPKMTHRTELVWREAQRGADDECADD